MVEKLSSQTVSPAFFKERNAIELAEELIGFTISTRFGENKTSGIIVETEAYCAPEDRASHAWNNRRTPRTEVMFAGGGVAYVYLCYGIHKLFNVICGPEGMPHAVLIRAVEPKEGIGTMLKRRGMSKPESRLTAGPGCLSKALGIGIEQNGLELRPENNIWLERSREMPQKTQIVRRPRIGIDYAGKWKDKPWRFYLKNSPWISKK